MTIRVDDETMTEAQFGRRLQWSACAGKVAVLHSVLNRLRDVAAEAYLDDKTEVADAVKRLAKEIAVNLLKEESEKLDAFIAENREGK